MSKIEVKYEGDWTYSFISKRFNATIRITGTKSQLDAEQMASQIESGESYGAR